MKWAPLLLLSVCALFGCQNSSKSEPDELVVMEETTSLLPIHYDFENLNLHLNAPMTNRDSDVRWKWDYMNSDNSYPDTAGVDFFMNHSQPSFSYNDEKTLPSLSIKTDGSRIIEFAATVIFKVRDRQTESIGNLLDSLTTFDLLRDNIIKQLIVEKGVYMNSTSEFEERLELTISENEYGYDRMTYTMKTVGNRNQ